MNLQRFETNVMGTRAVVALSAELPAADATRHAERAFEVMRDFEQEFSMFRADTCLSQVNAHAGDWSVVGARFLEAIRVACSVAAETNGVFSPLVGAFTSPHRATEPFVRDWQEIEFDDLRSAVRLPRGSRLDLNAVVKGWAIDEAIAAIPIEFPVLVEIGGDLRVRGDYGSEKVWPIGIRRPDRPKQLFAVIPTGNEAICTSGQYFRGELAQASGRSHLVNARTGGAPSHVTSFTVVAPTARMADILSTAGFLLPPPSAAALIAGHHDCHCLFVMSDGSVQASTGLEQRLRRRLTPHETNHSL